MNLEFDHVSKYYEMPEGGNRREVLKDVSMSVSPGDSLAIVGPSGSGKSTLLNILGGLDRPSEGKVVFNEKDLWSMNDSELSLFRNRHIGFVFQLHHLLPQLTVMENVLLPLVPSNDRVLMKDGAENARALLSQVGLGSHMQKRPGQMSVGECQRAAVVRALITKPDYILADEPTGSLDGGSAEILGDLLASLGNDRPVAVVVVTHSEKLAGKMKTRWYLNDGRLSKQEKI